MRMGAIFAGIASSTCPGHRMSINETINAQKRKAKKESRPKQPPKLSDDEVRVIRKLDAEKVPRRTIYDQHVAGKMSYGGMVNILEFVTRPWIV